MVPRNLPLTAGGDFACDPKPLEQQYMVGHRRVWLADRVLEMSPSQSRLACQFRVIPPSVLPAQHIVPPAASLSDTGSASNHGYQAGTVVRVTFSASNAPVSFDAASEEGSDRSDPLDEVPIGDLETFEGSIRDDRTRSRLCRGIRCQNQPS